ncbi:hypothetical protein Cni_G14679 [Canna indica]|uniref:Uncharacterized protein n=1 Tax=Canna indica TaxID=4628 RepID=A0AAQ3KFK8_9LILI|nr:hypothetical protein Cni_G14679 [Canna indica]
MKQWNEGKWIDEEKGYEKNSAQKLTVFIANALCFFWKNRNRVKFCEKAWSKKIIFYKAFAETIQFTGYTDEEIQTAQSDGRWKEKYFEIEGGMKILSVDASWKEGKKTNCGLILVQDGKVLME